MRIVVSGTTGASVSVASTLRPPVCFPGLSVSWGYTHALRDRPSRQDRRCVEEAWLSDCCRQDFDFVVTAIWSQNSFAVYYALAVSHALFLFSLCPMRASLHPWKVKQSVAYVARYVRDGAGDAEKVRSDINALLACSRPVRGYNTAAMSAWAQPIHMHPWLRMPSHKRKVYQRDSSDSPDPEPSAVPPKRRRCDVLENGLALLSLDPNLAHFSPQPVPYSVEPPPDEDEDMAVEPTDVWDIAAPAPSVRTSPTDTTPIVRPGSVEEPTSPESPPDVPDVAMKSRSWYEPEKDREPPPPVSRPSGRRAQGFAGIVVVDLDDSESEDEAEEAEQALRVNAALMARLMSRRGPLPPEPTDASKALVLFKPVVPPLPDGAGDAEEGRQETQANSGMGESSGSIDFTDYSRQTQPVVEDDPMDIEML